MPGIDAPCVDLVYRRRRYIIHPTVGGAARRVTRCSKQAVPGAAGAAGAHGGDATPSIQPAAEAWVGTARGTCCLLGTAADGCGGLPRDWLRRANATLLRRSGLVAGANADVWAAQGGSLNTYAVDADDLSTPIQLIQGAGGRRAYVNLYDQSTYRTGMLPGGTFAPPPSCDDAPPCASQFPCVRPAPHARVELSRSR